MSYFIRGQITVITAVIAAGGMIIASAFTAWATSSQQINAVEASVIQVTERENNHYAEVQKQLTAMDKKLDAIIKSSQ